MVNQQIIARGISDPNILNAMLMVPREKFVPKNLQSLAYTDKALPIGQNQSISQPYIVAVMTEALELKKDMTVLEIGTGSGYQAAILATMVNKVISIEVIPQLTPYELLKKYENLTLIVGDGTQGYAKEAPYDRIIVTAAASEIPKTLLKQLADGGIMVIPVGDTFEQRLLHVKKN